VFLLNPEKNWHRSVLSFSRKAHTLISKNDVTSRRLGYSDNQLKRRFKLLETTVLGRNLIMTSSWWCTLLMCQNFNICFCTNVSPPQRGAAVPTTPLSEMWAEMARQLPRGARPSCRPPIVWNICLAKSVQYRLLKVVPNDS